MAISTNTPYSIDDAFAVQYHTFVSMGAGLLIAETTGRTVSIVKRVGQIEDLLFFLPLCAFALSYSILFGFASLYGSSGALRSNPQTTAICSVTLCAFVFVATFIYR